MRLRGHLSAEPYRRIAPQPEAGGTRAAARRQPRVLHFGSMETPQDHDALLLREGGLAAAVVRNKEHILERFCARAQEELRGARRAPHPVLIDTLPALITRIAMALRRDSPLEYASQYSNIGLQHGNERARFTQYSLAEVLREYQFLRELLVEVLNEQAKPTAEEWRVVHRSVDEAMGEAASSFIKAQDEFRELFTAALTHDFRGPLQGALNHLQILLHPVQRDGELHARRAVQNLQRISRMVDRLLDVSRSNAGQALAVDITECDVHKLLDDVVSDLEPSRRERLALDNGAKITAHWDCEMMHRAVENLLDNAIKYSRPDSQIAIRVHPVEERVHISVHNEGDPIAPEDQEKLFMPFQRASVAHRSGKRGWGLGLVQVQAIAEAHAGAVIVESSPVDGTTFTLDVVRDARIRAP